MSVHKLPEALLDRERPIDILVAGAGGNGSHIVSGLARLHTALVALGGKGFHVTLCDPDSVSPSNAGRQLFAPADIGFPKANVLIHRLNMYYGLAWTAHASHAEDAPGHYEILIGCVDTAAARRKISRFCQARGVRYWLDLGNTATTGQVVLGEPVGPSSMKHIRERKKDAPTRLPTILELFPAMAKRRAAEQDGPSCSLAEALQKQDLFINQTLATLALHLLWTFLRKGALETHGYFVNLSTGRTSPIPIDPATWLRLGVDRTAKRSKGSKTPNR